MNSQSGWGEGDGTPPISENKQPSSGAVHVEFIRSHDEMSYCNLFKLSYEILSKGFVPSKDLGGEIGLKRCLCPLTHLLVGVEMGTASLER